MSINIVEELLGYSKDDLRRWEKAEYTIIDKRLPDHVRNIIIEKISNRRSNQKTPQFFSEVNILNHHTPKYRLV